MPPVVEAGHPREGMMAIVRNRRAMITRVRAYGAEAGGNLHLVDVDYTDGVGAESDQVLWEVEVGTDLLEPTALPQIATTRPMDPRELDAMVRAARWSALTPSLPFSGLAEDRPALASPLYGAIHPEAYQLVPVLRALEMPRVALMLADAVGLGKTIQAGLVIRELMLRRRIRRVLVLCPAALRTQWRDEMSEKFSLPFDVVDRPETLRLQRELGIDANPWRTHERIVASYHYLKQPDVLEQFRATGEPGDDGRLRWDLLVVDEAHNLAPASFGADSDLAQMLQQIAPWFEHRLFLTATPHNGHTRSFSGLLETLDPVRFTRKSTLDPEDRTRVGEAVIRRLKSEINHFYTAQGQPARFSERTVVALPVLHFGASERGLQLAFHSFRRALKRAMSGASPAERIAGAFATEVLQKRLLSGPWPFGQSWRAMIEGMADAPAAGALAAPGVLAETVARAKAAHDDDTDNDAEKESRQRHAERTVGAWMRAWKAAVAAEIDEVTGFVDLLDVPRVAAGLEPEARRTAVDAAAQKVRADARLGALEKLLDQRVRTGQAWHPDERIVVFTEYLATLEYLRARLVARYGPGDWLRTLYGGMSDRERDDVKRAFNDPHSPARILVATDAAGEGLNLQRSGRLLLHWDIPWNPGKMEQRNGRLDRHGQERDVEVFHFDSADDASMRFLGRVLRKRSQTREDRVVTDELFADAILAHFEHDEDPAATDERLDRAINAARRTSGGEEPDDLPEAAPMPGLADQERLEALRAELDLTPASLRETLETALAVETSRPRLQSDGRGRDRLVMPVPRLWEDLVDQTLREATREGAGALPALVFDPAHYVVTRAGRPVYVPEPDSRLLHLGHELYHRVMSTFARYRFPGGPAAATRWTVRTGPVDDADALVLVTVEELAVNDLREPCHHWVKTLVLPVRNGVLGAALPHRPASEWAGPARVGDRDAARDLWDNVDTEVKQLVGGLQSALTASLKVRLKESGVLVTKMEKQRFDRRRKELHKALGDTQIEKLRKEAAKIREKAKQVSMYAGMDDDLAKKLADLDAELLLRRGHYEGVLRRIDEEEERTLKGVLPPRYRLRGEARVYPIAVEIRLPGAEA